MRELSPRAAENGVQAVRPLPVRRGAPLPLRSLTLTTTITSRERYCSRECQRLAWPTHKQHCEALAAMRDLLKQPEYRQARVESAMLTKWLLTWSDVVVGCGLLGMDIIRHPDRPRTHGSVHASFRVYCHNMRLTLIARVFLEVEFREPKPSEQCRWFKVSTSWHFIQGQPEDAFLCSPYRLSTGALCLARRYGPRSNKSTSTRCRNMTSRHYFICRKTPQVYR